MLRLSIIIPFYNVEKYIAECLDSVFDQDIPLEEYEVICVNDGSPDNSLSICEEYALKYPNIKIISQPNAGLSAARNTGVKNATGEYLLFLDSDDYLLSNVIGGILCDIEKYNPDVICCNISPNGQGLQLSSTFDLSKSVSGTEFVECFYKHFHFGYPTEVWHYICRRTFLLEKNLWNKEGYLHEDEDFTPRLLLNAEKVCYHKEPILFYRVQRQGAISATKTNRNILHKLQIAMDLLNYYKHFPGDVHPIFYEMLYALSIDSIVEAKQHRLKEGKRLHNRLIEIAHNNLTYKATMVSKLNAKWAQLYFYGHMPKVFKKLINIIYKIKFAR